MSDTAKNHLTPDVHGGKTVCGQTVHNNAEMLNRAIWHDDPSTCQKCVADRRKIANSALYPVRLP